MADEDDVTTTYDRVRAAFGPHAQNYTTSPGHADVAALAELVRRVGPRATDRMLDVGTGAGHTGLAFAPHVAAVVAYDLTPEMLAEVRRNAAARGLRNVTVQRGAAEALPFASASFEIVACRMTTHHFAALPRAVAEMARVLSPGGRLLIVDTMVPEDDELDREINEIEVLRDPSHVRNYRPSEWRTLLTGAGLTVVDAEIGYHDEGGGMDLDEWTSRIGTNAANVAALRARFTEADPRLSETLRIVRAGDAIRFALPRLTLVARR
jgi:ubiquinone/menaquinone biosynthesis C-methylase UbiE